ncbi:MAG: hypothetical protein VX325_00130 [Bacteroidota bacterium]|nr:hypothetical protein [Bacteroidota bacterium]
MIKSFYTPLVCLIFLTSNIGFAFNVHICGGSVSEISFIWDKAGCDMPDHKEDSHQNSYQYKAEDCCSDEIMMFQNSETEWISLKQTNDSSNNFSILTNQEFFSKEIYFSKLNQEKTKHPPRGKLFLLYRSFIFYG